MGYSDGDEIRGLLSSYMSGEKIPSPEDFPDNREEQLLFEFLNTFVPAADGATYVQSKARRRNIPAGNAQRVRNSYLNELNALERHTPNCYKLVDWMVPVLHAIRKKHARDKLTGKELEDIV